MHIVNIMQCTNLGGMEKAALRLMIGLKARGHSIEVISLNPLGALAPGLEEANIAAQGFPYRGIGGWRSFHLIYRVLRRKSADALIMTGHNLMAMLALGSLCRGRRLLAIHFHHEGVKPKWQWKLIYFVATRVFDFITFPSDYVRGEAEIICPSIKPIARTVRNPLPLPPLFSDEDRRQARLSLGLPVDAIVIGNAGWLIDRKRFDVFLRVAARVRQKLHTAYFVIAGDGENREKLGKLAEGLGVGQVVRWLGWLTDMSRFYAALDVLLFNTDGDAFPNSPLEAMSYGIPVVGSSTRGGLREILTNESCGALFESHDIDGMASAIASILCKDKKLLRQVNRARVVELCDAASCAIIVEALLETQGGVRI